MDESLVQSEEDIYDAAEYELSVRPLLRLLTDAERDTLDRYLAGERRRSTRARAEALLDQLRDYSARLTADEWSVLRDDTSHDDLIAAIRARLDGLIIVE